MREKIEEYIKCLAAEKNIAVDNSTNLFTAGILDSFGIILLLAFVDETLGINLHVDALEEDKFKTIDSIIEFLNKETN